MPVVPGEDAWVSGDIPEQCEASGGLPVGTSNGMVCVEFRRLLRKAWQSHCAERSLVGARKIKGCMVDFFFF